MENPNFYAIIPANVRYSDIMANAKLLYGEITALCNKKGYCYATNAYFASLYHVDSSQVKRWIKNLSDSGFVTVEVNIEQGNTRIIRICENAPTLGAKTPRPSGRKRPDPRGENAPYNNTMNNTMNNTDIIILIDEEEKKEKEIENEEIDNIEDLRRFLNKGKLQEDYYYKIGDEQSFERATSDFFIFCDDNQRKMKKKTIEAKFRAYLKPKYETDEDRKNMIDSFRRKKEKKNYTVVHEENIEDIKTRREKEDEIIRNIEDNLPSDRLIELKKQAENEIKELLGNKTTNRVVMDLMIVGRYKKLLLSI